MFLKIQLLILNLASAILLILFLCLGSQKQNRVGYNINLLGNEIAELPVGFLVGTSFTLGLLSGGLTSTLFIDNNIKDDN